MLLLPAAVTKRICGARQGPLGQLEVGASDLLALLGRLADAALLEIVLVGSDAATPTHVDDARALLAEEVDIGPVGFRVALGLLRARAGIGFERVAERDAADDQARMRVAGHGDAGHMGAVFIAGSQAELFEGRLVLLGRQAGQPALDLAGLGAVEVGLQIGEALGARPHLRQLVAQVGRDRHQIARGRPAVFVEGDERCLAGFVALQPGREELGVTAAVPDRDRNRRACRRGR